MKVVHVTSVHPLHDTRILYKECMTLAANGYEVVLVAAHDTPETFGGVRISPIPKYSGRLKRFALGSWMAYRAASKESADVYHLHDPELLIVGQLLRLGGKRVIFDMHENVPASITDKGWIPAYARSLVRSSYYFLERILLRKLSVIFAETSYRKHYNYVKVCTSILNFPFSRLASSVTTDRFPPSQGLAIGYMGGVSKNRGAEVILEALALLDAHAFAATWHCVGGVADEYLSVLKSRVEKFKHVKVIFYGRMRPEEGWRLMAKCDVGVAVLMPIANYIESYPTKLFEYMAVGIPVITSNFDLYRSVVDRYSCGLCVNPTDPNEIYAALLSIKEDAAGATDMGRRGREAILSEFNWEKEGQKLIEFYADGTSGLKSSRRFRARVRSLSDDRAAEV